VTAAVRRDTADRLLFAAAAAQRTTRQPSLVAGVVRSGELVWSAACGDVTGGPETGPDLQYRIGSITKTLTALAVMQCRQEGLVALTDPIGDVLGEVPFATATVRQLLSHTAGLPAEPVGPWWERHEGGDFHRLADQIKGQVPVLPVGGQQHYSNLGYALLGQLVAQLRGQPWLQVVEERILLPLGMRRTTYAPQQPHATGYSVHPWSRRLVPEPHTDTGAMAPAGQLWSTLGDLARYAAFWLDPDPAVLDGSALREMRIPVGGRADGGLEASYGLGLTLAHRPGRALFGHSGSMPGFLARMCIDPEQGTAAVALSNGTTGETPGLPYALLDALTECEPRPASPWRPEPELPGVDELLGPWYWGNTPFALVVEGGRLVLDSATPGRRSRFEIAGTDRWHGLDQYFTGETLDVVRDAAGAVHHLELATYELTRTPYGG